MPIDALYQHANSCDQCQRKPKPQRRHERCGEHHRHEPEFEEAVGAIVGSMISSNGFFELWFMTMMLTTAFVPPLCFGLPLTLIATVGVLAKRINRQKAFYGTNPDEARRLKALEPVSL